MKPRRPQSKRVYVFDVYRARDGWRWRLFARNGRVVAGSSLAYDRKAAAVVACKKLRDMGTSLIVTEGVELE